MQSLIRNRFVEEVLPIVMQQVAGAAHAAGAGAGGANPLMKNVADTATAQRMAEFSDDSYNPTGAPPDAIPLKNYDDPKSGFFASTYRDQRTGNIVLAYRGSEKTGNDWWTNVTQALGFKSTQYSEAADVAEQVRREYPNENIVITGHSLGGGLAAVGAAKIGVTATTFNAAGVNPATFARLGLDPSNLPNLVTNYRVEGEALTGIQAHPAIFVGALGGIVGAIAGGGGGALEGAQLGAAIGSGIPSASGRQIDLPAIDANGNPLSINPATRHLMPSVIAALAHQRQQETMGGW